MDRLTYLEARGQMKYCWAPIAYVWVFNLSSLFTPPKLKNEAPDEKQRYFKVTLISIFINKEANS